MNPLDINQLQSDIPEQIARAAHSHTSWDPERRGDKERAIYARTLVEDFENMLALANTDDKRAELHEQFERYRAGYKRRYLGYLLARSRCASAMITGPANFPVARQEKANRRADKHSADLLEYRKRALAAIRKVLTPELAPIMLGDSDAAERLEDKIARLEALQERMVAVNKAIRKHAKAGAEAQIAAIVALPLGIPEGAARDMLKPDCFGNIGYASYELTNNNANLKRLKGRLVAVERLQSTPDSTLEGVHARFEDCPSENRVRLFFPGKPDEATRTKLKSSGFRWAPSQGAWSAYRNFHTLTTAKAVAGVL